MASPTEPPPGDSGATIGSSSPSPPSRAGWRAREKKAVLEVEATYLDQALHGFTGYLAIDELYDGPYCLLSLVDSHAERRLAYRVLERDATKEDIRALLLDFRREVDRRGLVVRGVTTDGSSLYPEPLAEVFPKASHQICEFHLKHEILKQVRHALAKERKALTAGLKKGQKDPVSQKKRARKRELYEGRPLWLKKKLSRAERKKLARLCQGQRRLKSLRQIVEEMYRLFDRRCRMETALARLWELRKRVKRHRGLEQTLSKLWSPGLEKALTFLKDPELTSTSNAVERANRRHRKMQKAIYRTREHRQLQGRIALDLLREHDAVARFHLVHALHAQRAA